MKNIKMRIKLSFSIFYGDEKDSMEVDEELFNLDPTYFQFYIVLKKVKRILC